MKVSCIRPIFASSINSKNMIITLINAAALVAFAAVAIDMVLQIRRVWVRKSSADISVTGVSVRTAATFLIFAKLIVLRDVYLLIGQVSLILLVSMYLVLVIRYRHRV